MISIVIPAFNERDSLVALCSRIHEVGEEARLVLEVLLVDDGSTDGSWSVIEALARTHESVRGLRFRRNFGKAAALRAGFSAARGDLVVTMDADLQDDPAEIPRFLEALRDKDVVSGWKKRRHDPWHKVLPSRVFNALVSRVTGVSLHDHNCGMKMYRAEVLREVSIRGELHRFIPVLAASRGFRVGEMVVRHRSRVHGRSKYGASRFIKGLLDLMSVKLATTFGHRPHHALGTLGLGALVLAACALIGSAVHPGAGASSLMFSMAAGSLGIHMLALGIVADLVTSTSAEYTAEYSVAADTKLLPSSRDAAGRGAESGAASPTSGSRLLAARAAVPAAEERGS